MDLTSILFTGVTVLFIIELLLRPRIDQTEEGWYLVWYGRRKRHYFKLFKGNPPEK